MNCELCGIKTAKFDAEIEGTAMKVCEDCARYGQIKANANTNVKIVYEDKKKFEMTEPEYLFITGYGSIVKNARERLRLKQEEMAKKLNVRESLLHQIESEHYKPNIDLARKLERELHIKIVEEIKDESSIKADPKRDVNAASKSQSGPMTLGDMLGKKK
jgi:putative transcription factor